MIKSKYIGIGLVLVLMFAGGWLLFRTAGLAPETTSKVAVEKDRRRMKANQIRRAVKRHSQVNNNRRAGSRNNNG